jgi:hypothetical protein
VPPQHKQESFNRETPLNDVSAAKLPISAILLRHHQSLFNEDVLRQVSLLEAGNNRQNSPTPPYFDAGLSFFQLKTFVYRKTLPHLFKCTDLNNMNQQTSTPVKLGYTDFTMPPVVQRVPPVDPLDRPIVVQGPNMRKRFGGGWLENVHVHELISKIDVNRTLCSVCKSIDLVTIISAQDGLGQDLWETFSDLEKSAKKGCPLCAIIYNSIQVRGPYGAGQKSLVTLRAFGRGEGDLPEGFRIRYLEALFYCRDPFQGTDVVSRSFLEPMLVKGVDRVLKVQGKPLAVYAEPGK